MPQADVGLVLEGTYPYVSGGVSSWIHDLIKGLPTVRFTLAHIGPERGAYGSRKYELPPNVVGLSDLYCREQRDPRPDVAALHRAARAESHRHAGSGGASRVLRALRRLHLGDASDSAFLDDLASGDLSVGAFLHGRASLELTTELYERLAPDASFLGFFWHFRSMHLPLIRLLGAQAPPAAVYHALCTGYAGLLAAVWSHRTNRPLILTEHGIYTSERRMELSRAAWFEDPSEDVTASPLRRMWMRFFRELARCAYDRASVITSLSDASRARQIEDGAPPHRTRVVPNGIDPEDLRARVGDRSPRFRDRSKVCVAFVGRVVPIKDVVTFIHACSLALRVVDVDVRIFGPLDEDRAYVRRCRRLLASLGLARAIRVHGPQPIERVYPEIDVLVLTSISEGQPLVILEASALGIPVVASDVGACRELIEGRTEADRRIGPSGIVTRLGAPEETAAAIARLAGDAALRRKLGDAGQRRVADFYQQSHTLSTYRALYRGERWQALAGVSSA